MIPNDFIDELLARVDIVDVVGESVRLKKSGANYMGCCPFHDEKTPSFSVSPSKQFYHCFGCGAHGSAIRFLMENQGIGFVAAVENLAGRVGMRMPAYSHESAEDTARRARRKKQRQSLADVLASAALFYQGCLKTHSVAMDYVRGRGLDDAVIVQYGLGYAPDEWQALEKAIKPYPSEQLTSGGMVIEKDGRFYDRFRHRLMFPIRDAAGQVIGFGGRVIDDGEPKYLNSPETPLFDKGKNLYGLYEATQSIRQSGRIVVVEGYMDVVALAQYGIGYAVAALGTATTPDHIRLLMRRTDEVCFCFDGDAAGRRAARRAMENALPLLKDGKSFKFLFLPSEHDPDSYVRALGREAFEQALGQSLPLSDYFWQSVSEGVNLNTDEGRAELLRHAGGLIATITQAPALSLVLRRRLASMTGLDLVDVDNLMGTGAPKRAKAHRYHLPKHSFRHPVADSLASTLTSRLLMNPEWAADAVLPEYLLLEPDEACLNILAARIRACTILPNGGRILELMRGTGYESRVEDIFQAAMRHDDEYGSSHLDRQAFCEGVVRLLRQIRMRQIECMKEKVSQGTAGDDDRALLRILLQSVH